jgi:methylenetetrahydrofolate reductase (NADPH)
MSQFEDLITKTKEQVFTAEFPVIDGEGFSKVEKYAKRLKPWFVAVNATDNTAAHAHASNVASAIAMKMHGIEPIMQVVCRDKNRLAIQADIVGASLHGIENICALTGDDVTAGDETEARRVFDLDGPQLIRLATTISRGEYMSGRKIDPAPHLFVGAVENPSAPPFEYRVQRVAKKVAAGARFLQLQISYHPDRLEKFCQGVVAAGLDRHVALLPTIVLIKGSRPLKFMNDKVPGIDVPQDVIDRVDKAADQAEEAYKQTLELSQHALSLPGVRGLHVTDFRHDDTLDRLMTDLGRTPRALN